MFFRNDNRKDIIVATKVCMSVENILEPDPKKPNSHGLSRKHIVDAVEDSLKRLQTDYIDLYQVSETFVYLLQAFPITTFPYILTIMVFADFTNKILAILVIYL